MKNKTTGDLVFNFCNTVVMIFLVVVTLYPFWYVAVTSFSEPAQVMSDEGLLFWPKSFDFSAYKAVIENPNIATGYRNTLFYLTVGTTMNMIFTTFLAYGLSRKNVLWTGLLMKLILFTMFFSGGLIPGYMLVKGLHLIGSVWAVILPGLISTFNLIIMRTAFQSIPRSLEESARIDGANELTILSHIVIPLSMPTMAVMILYYSVGHWNSWFNASLYLNERSMFPLQLILREILVVNAMEDMTTEVSAQDRVSVQQTIQYATIMVATIPILCIYPFLQRYFVKGVMIGAIKS